MQLQDTVAIVTGGNGGLGQRICHALAKAGSHIVVVYTQSREAARAVASEFKAKRNIDTVDLDGCVPEPG